MTQDNGMDIPVDELTLQQALLRAILETAIEMLPQYNDPAWGTQPDNLRNDVSFCREYLERAYKNKFGAPEKRSPAEVTYPDKLAGHKAEVLSDPEELSRAVGLHAESHFFYLLGVLADRALGLKDDKDAQLYNLWQIVDVARLLANNLDGVIEIYVETDWEQIDG